MALLLRSPCIFVPKVLVSLHANLLLIHFPNLSQTFMELTAMHFPRFATKAPLIMALGTFLLYFKLVPFKVQIHTGLRW